MQKTDMLIVGAGAAGLMCAMTAAKRGLSVVVIELAEKPGKKILISGGGRCNFTNTGTTHENFLSANPHFCKSALANFTPEDFTSLIKKHGIEYYEKKLGQLFCKKSSKLVVDMLTKECRDANVLINCGEKISDINKYKLFKVFTDHASYECANLVIASGGLSIPKMGATGFGYEVAKQFGHKVIDLSPGLVPLILNERQRNEFSKLTGVSASVIVNAGKISFVENILFTHKGLSGPAILQASSYWNPEESIRVNFLNEETLDSLRSLRNKNLRLSQFIYEILPQRLAETLIPNEFLNKRIAEISDKKLDELSKHLSHYEFYPVGTEGFEKAEVTCGGVDTSQLSSKTMESKLIKGLYFIGEVVDVTGWLGGYNFQWAWASGYAAGMSAQHYDAAS